MKKYNKPVVEINGFEVEDVITASAGSLSSEKQGVYVDLVGSGSADAAETVQVFEW